MKRPVYFDYNATTPVDPRVLERMLPYFSEHFGNPSSRGHAFGWRADEAVEQAREQVAALVGAEPAEIVFTAGATESVNLAVKGVARAYADRGRHLVTVATEHKAVLEACAALERDGWRVTRLPVGTDGRVDPAAVEAALTAETVLVAVMAANNETGVRHPIDEIAGVVRPRGILLLSDATQAVGKVPVDVRNVDLLALSGHKFYAPKGVGALYVRRRDPRVRLVPLLDGGGQERGLRGGTLNVPGIVALGAAAALAASEGAADAARLEPARDRLEAALRRLVPGLRVVGEGAPRLPQTSSLSFPGLHAAALMAGLRDLALSAGSACSSGNGRPSHVLKAMGLSDDEALGTLRISLGRMTTREEVDFAIDALTVAVEDLLKAPSLPAGG